MRKARRKHHWQRAERLSRCIPPLEAAPPKEALSRAMQQAVRNRECAKRHHDYSAVLRQNSILVHFAAQLRIARHQEVFARQGEDGAARRGS